MQPYSKNQCAGVPVAAQTTICVMVHSFWYNAASSEHPGLAAFSSLGFRVFRETILYSAPTPSVKSLRFPITYTTMAKPKKKREKKYHPKEVSMRPALLKKMTLSQKVVRDSVDTMRTALMRLKLHEKKGGDMVLIVIYLGTCWYLADRMENGEELQAYFGGVIETLKKEVYVPGPMSQETFDAVADALPSVASFLSQITYEEMDVTHKAIEDGKIAIVEEFLALIGAQKQTEGIRCEQKLQPAS